jgi:F0F1-type ATP synthase gamma subunit
MSAVEQMKGQPNDGGELAIASVGKKLTPILTKRAEQVAKTIAEYNAAEDDFIAKKLGASSLSTPESGLDVMSLFATH